MPDQDFERAFATLAHAELAQKAPGLMPYLIGFQVVEKNDDGSRAAGVFGFKVGEQWYYGPVFWLSGKIRGYDLLYIVGQDLFVPLQESWVNYVTNRRPYVMGDGVLDKNLTQMGVMQPDFTIFRRSPLTKGACARIFKGSYENWCKPAAMYLPPNDEKYAGLDQRISLPVVLTKFSALHTEAVLKAMKGNTKFAEAVYRFYSPADIAVAAKSIGQSSIFKKADLSSENMISSKGKKQDTKVKVLYGTTNLDADETKQLSAKEREQLMHGDAVVDDKREAKERSEVYKEPEYEKVFQTPSISGAWKIMTRTDGNRDALVGIHVIPIGKAAVPPNAAVVIDLENKKYALCYKQDILAKTQIDPMNWQRQFEKFRTAQNIGAGDVGVLVTKDFIVSQPFKVLKSTTDKEGNKILCVRPDSSISGPKNTFGEVKDDLKPPTQPSMAGSSVRDDRVKHYSDGDIGKPGCCNGNAAIAYKFSEGEFHCDAGSAARSASYDSDSYKRRCCGHHIRITKKPVSMSNVQDTLIVNQDDVRFLPLSVDSKATKSDWGGWSNLDLAGQADMDVQIRKMGMEKLSVHWDSHNMEFAIYGVSKREKSAGMGKALKTLMVDFGMGETDARTLLKEARLKTKTACLVKMAAPFPPGLNMDPISTYDSTYKSNVQTPQSQNAMIPSNAPYPNMQESMQPIVDQHAQSMATGASNQGQKEVFDLSLLSSLIRSGSDIEGKIQDFLKDVILGNDRIGRILFMFYWHNDKFTEKYGDKDLMELEELLRETFKTVGELVLFLKQKSIEPESVASESVVAI